MWGEIFEWYLIISIISYAIFIIFIKYFKRMHDKGVAASKIFGIVLTSYVAFVFGFFRLLELKKIFFLSTIIIILLSVVFFLTQRRFIVKCFKEDYKAILTVEFLFLISFIFYLLIRMKAPEIFGAEKFMDFGIINSILRSDYLPIEDMWLSGHLLNYYYFGHFMSAMLITLSGVKASVGYNLMLGLLFAISVVLSYGIAFDITKKIRYGLLASFFVVVAGNMQPVVKLIMYNRLLPFSYWDASRIIPGTINEFPFFTFIHGDLHAHVFAIPIFMMFVFLIYNLFIKYSAKEKMAFSDFILVSLLFSISFMTSSWDIITEAIIFGLFLIFLKIKKIKIKEIFLISAATLLFFVFFSLPHLIFVHNARLILPVKDMSSISGVMTIYFVFFFIIMIFLFLFLRHLKRKTILPLIFVLAIASIITFFNIRTFLIILFIILMYLGYLGIKQNRKIQTFSILLCVSGLTVLLVAESIFLVNQGGRMNMVFKLGIHAWMLLGLGCSILIYQIIQSSNYRIKKYITFILLLLIFLSSIYPLMAIATRYSSYSGTLDGINYLEKKSKDVKEAIEFLNNNIKERSIIVEGYGPIHEFSNVISSNTGLPTLLGWIEHHEIQWNPNKITEIKERLKNIDMIYTSKNKDELLKLLQKYNVNFIIFGPAERHQYNKVNEIFEKEFKVYFENENVKVFMVKQND